MKDFPLNFRKLNFRKFSDECPTHGQEIFYIDQSEFYGSYEFRYGTVEHQWEELDEQEHSTGTCFLFEDGEPQPPNTRLLVIVDGQTMQPNTLWITCMAIEKVLEQVEKES